MRNTRFLLLTLLIVMAAAIRLVPHPPNFAPIAAIALFGGAYFSSRTAAFIVPVAAMFVSDLFLGLHSTMIYVYGAFILTVFIGFALQSNKQLLPVAGAAVGSSLLFFIITNFGVWLSGTMYSHTLSGLVSCYVAAIPFFKNTLLSGLIYTGALFGTFEFLKRWYPSLQKARVQN